MIWSLSCENFQIWLHFFCIELAIVPIILKNPLLYIYAQHVNEYHSLCINILYIPVYVWYLNSPK